MEIRSATKNDLAVCEQLGRIPEFKLPSGGHLGADFLENYLDRDFFLVAEENNEVIGYLIAEPLKGKVAILWFITMKDAARNKGFGTKLLAEFEERAKIRGIEWIVLYAPNFNQQTLKFYQKHGYNLGKSFTECNKQL
ncbi:GNAT family N-acetyltransferase [Candidatus Microgenomates bacterium]|nr:GNAT family N-acetyltransferase [Candidatus Microgenomates bacterium]